MFGILVVVSCVLLSSNPRGISAQKIKVSSMEILENFLFDNYQGSYSADVYPAWVSSSGEKHYYPFETKWSLNTLGNVAWKNDSNAFTWCNNPGFFESNPAGLYHWEIGYLGGLTYLPDPSSVLIHGNGGYFALIYHSKSDSVISGIGANTNYILLLFTQASYPYKNTAQYNAIPTDGFPMPTQFALNNEEDTLYIASNNFVYATHEYVWALYSLELSSKNYTTLWTGKSQLFIEYDHYKNNLLVFFWNGNAWNITVMTKPGVFKQVQTWKGPNKLNDGLVTFLDKESTLIYGCQDVSAVNVYTGQTQLNILTVQEEPNYFINLCKVETETTT